MKTRDYLFRFGLVALGFAAGSFCPAAWAATTDVDVADFQFTPGSVTIDVNDSVQWNFSSGFHSSTSSSSVWNSGDLSAPDTFSFMFTSSGDFPYFCQVHTFMTASVTVNSASLPPSVSITNPPGGSTFASPWTGTLKASVAPGSGTVTNVQFFDSTTSLGNVAVAPYNLTVSNEPAGSYSLKAVASDNLGSKGTSGVVNVTIVSPVATILTAPSKINPDQFRFTYSADSGLTYVVQRSGGLPSFSGIATNVANSSSVSFTDTTATGSFNLYRVGRLPNP